MTMPFNDLFIEHPLFVRATDLIGEVERRTEAGERLILPLFGPTRVGKNYATMRLQRKYAERMDGFKTVRECLLVKVPARPTLRSMPDCILSALGLPLGSIKGNKDVRTDRAIELLKLSGTAYLIFDEIQHLFEAGRRTQDRDVSDWIKNFAEAAGVSIILLGMPLGLHVLDVNEQLRDRAMAPHLILPYHWGHPQERTDFEGVVETILDTLRDHGYVFNIAEPFTLALYCATGGRVGMLVKLLKQVCDLVRQTRLVTLATFSDAHRKTVHHLTTGSNPFEQAALGERDASDAYWSVLRQSNCSTDVLSIMQAHSADSPAEKAQYMRAYRDYLARAGKAAFG